MATSEQFRVVEVSPSYWRVSFANGPVNLVDVDTIDQLTGLVERIEEAPELTVVLFRSDNTDYFMGHWDFESDPDQVAAMPPGPTGLHPYLDNLVRLSKVPAATICAIRGRARGAGSEFALATDIRFAAGGAILGQFEVGVGAVPGGGPMARLARLVGRGRALEILLGGEDYPAVLAAEYGYVNRVVPDAELEEFTDRFARRIAAFDRVAVSGIKQLVDLASLPPDAELVSGFSAYLTTSGRPENASFVRLLFEHGLQQPGGIETELGADIGELRQQTHRLGED
jgi:enoyl-CoA hydratase/carnithine racemase